MKKVQIPVLFSALVLGVLALATSLRPSTAAFGAGSSSTLQFTHLSTTTNDLEVPANGATPDGSQLTASLILDINRDNVNDFVIAARRFTGSGVFWYERTDDGWVKHVVDDSILRIEAGGTYYDVDGDQDLDIIFGGDSASNEVWWWENPYPNYADQWTRRTVKASGGTKHHDMAIGDVDDDGAAELVFWNQRARGKDEGALMVAEIPTDPKNVAEWTFAPIFEWSGGDEYEGMDIADVDGDGVLDIVGGGRWFKYDAGQNDYSPEVVFDGLRFGRSAAGQLIPGGRAEIVLSAGDNSGPIRWYRWSNGTWISTNLLAGNVESGHSLQLVDANQDGDLDIFSAEMRLNGGNSDAKMRIWYGDGTGNFQLQEVSTGIGNHESKVGDLDGDGDLDILGKPYNWDTPRLDIWLNELTTPCRPSLDEWQRHVIDNARDRRAVFVLPGDLNGDDLPDVVASKWWYENPGAADGTWTRREIGAPLNQIAALYDFDDNGTLDILGTIEGANEVRGDTFAWARNDGSGNFTLLDNIQGGDGDFLQGVAIADYDKDGLPEVALSWHKSNTGNQILQVPTNPSTETWSISTLSTTSQNEQLSAGDIDRDGDIDLSMGTMWLRNDFSGTQQTWHDAERRYRVPITVSGNGTARADAAADIDLNFTTLLAAAGGSGVFAPGTIRVVEVDGAGALLDDSVPYQFDQASAFDAAGNASGTLILLLTNATGANQDRHYEIYFDTTAQTVTPVTVTARVHVTDNVQDEGFSSFHVVTDNVEY